MIKVNGKEVSITGDKKEILDDLIRLNLAITEKKEFMAINQFALEIVARVLSDDGAKGKYYGVRNIKDSKIYKSKDIHEDNDR